MSANSEYPNASNTNVLHRGWTDLQRREAQAVLQWLHGEQRLRNGFVALATALRTILSEHVRTASEARAVWDAVPAVLERCNDPDTYKMQSAGIAYAWLHLLDRYARTWLALEHLLRQGLLPMGRYGVRVLDVGTGPGPSAFATHDFYAALEDYAQATDALDWQQPPDITCVECAHSMNHIRHLLAEHLFSTGAPRSVLGMTGGLHDFCAIRPTRERRQIEHNLRNQYEEYYDEHQEEWHDEPTHTPEEANREANSHHRYRLFTFSNFLTSPERVSAFQENLNDILVDARPGSVLLMIGATGGCYPDIQKQMARLADAGGFRRRNDPKPVATVEARLDGRLREEVSFFYRLLKELAGDLPAHESGAAAQFRGECEGDRQMTFPRSTVHAFRK